MLRSLFSPTTLHLLGPLSPNPPTHVSHIRLDQRKPKDRRDQAARGREPAGGVAGLRGRCLSSAGSRVRRETGLDGVAGAAGGRGRGGHGTRRAGAAGADGAHAGGGRGGVVAAARIHHQRECWVGVEGVEKDLRLRSVAVRGRRLLLAECARVRGAVVEAGIDLLAGVAQAGPVVRLAGLDLRLRAGEAGGNDSVGDALLVPNGCTLFLWPALSPLVGC